jgi:hypothetical protein
MLSCQPFLVYDRRHRAGRRAKTNVRCASGQISSRWSDGDRTTPASDRPAARFGIVCPRRSSKATPATSWTAKSTRRMTAGVCISRAPSCGTECDDARSRTRDACRFWVRVLASSTGAGAPIHKDRRGASARRPGSPAAGGQVLLPVVIPGRIRVISGRACATVIVNEQTCQVTGSRPPLQEPVPGCQA